MCSYLEKHDTKVKELLADVELILSDANILQEMVGQGVRTAGRQRLLSRQPGHTHMLPRSS